MKYDIVMENNILSLIQSIQNFKGDPNSIAQQLISSGRYTKEQIEQAKQKATELEQALNVLGFGKGR